MPYDHREHWNRQRRKVADIRNSGRAVVKRAGTRVQVICAQNEGLITQFLKLEGRWRHRSGVWSFPKHRYYKLMELLEATFGKDKIEQ